MTPSVAIQDLAADKLILSAVRMDFEDKKVPALGGIPLLAKLGQGGMGAVYYGIHPRLNKEVAVKVLPFHLAQQQPEMVGRFFREAQMASSVFSDHLVGVTDVNEESGLFYLVMEFVSGMSAGAYLREVREIGKTGAAESIALDICIAAARGLAAAHAAGIVHRDVKPDNILIPKDRAQNNQLAFSSAKLADLGLACSEELSHSITGSQACMGTPGYMSPEQALDAKTCGKPTDVFSLGATLYALLSGKAPFTASTLMKILLATQNEAHAPIRALRPDVSEVTAALIDRCLHKDPAKRFTDASAMLSALKLCRGSIHEPADTLHAIAEMARIQQTPEVGTPIRTESTIFGDRPVATATSTPLPQMVVPAPRRNRFWLAACAALLLAAAGVAGMYQLIRTQTPAKPQVSSDEVRPVATPKVEPEKSVASVASVAEEPPAPATKTVSEPEREPVKKESIPAVDPVLQEALENRRQQFNQFVADGQKNLNTLPQKALELFGEAEKLGAADESKHYPDLLSEVKPSLADRKTDARSAISMAMEQFKAGFEAARSAAEKKDWCAVHSRLEKAFADLVGCDSPFKTDADNLLVESNKKCDAFSTSLSEANALLKANEFTRAKTLFETAAGTWPTSPEIEKVRSGIAQAEHGLSDVRYEAAMKSGNENLTARNWKLAESEFNKAIHERDKDTSALKGIEAAHDGSRDDEFAASMAEAQKIMGNNNVPVQDIRTATDLLNRAKVPVQHALSLKAENVDALYLSAVIDATLFTLNKSFDEAEKALAKAKGFKPDDPSTQRVADMLALARKNEAARIEAMKLKGVVEVQNENTGMNVTYSLRWRLYDGSFSAWETKTIQSGKSSVHWCPGATKCQLQFNSNISGGNNTITSDLEFHNIPAEQQATGKAAKTYYIELNKSRTALELSNTKATSILKALGTR
jgi:serine/threonine protein kinase/tetratricopeptide (TPR) repeat protein